MKTSLVISHNGKKNKNFNNYSKINFSARCKITHESESQVEQFDEKIEGKKSCGTSPLKVKNKINVLNLHIEQTCT
jgi:hypothetical protein